MGDPEKAVLTDGEEVDQKVAQFASPGEVIEGGQSQLQEFVVVRFDGIAVRDALNNDAETPRNNRSARGDDEDRF
jgi:hypothetical protein